MIHLWSSFGESNGWGSLAHGFGTALGDLETVIARPWFPDADRLVEPEIGVGLGPWQCMPRVRGRLRVAAVVGETSRIPASRLRFVRDAHQVWAPTEWGRDVLAGSGIERETLRVVPYGVDSELFRPATEPTSHHDETGVFRFLCVGKWERRKGQELLVRAFCRAFEPSAPVELQLHCHNPYRPGFDVRRVVVELMNGEGGGPPIRLSTPKSSDDMVQLYQHADAFVLPTRGEGWGLPVLEAMACGLPLVVTDHPALRTFVGRPHAHLIEARSTPVDDLVFFDPDDDWGDWLEPDMDHLVELLRRVAGDPDAARRAGRASRREALRWTWRHAAQRGKAVLDDLRHQRTSQPTPLEEMQCA